MQCRVTVLCSLTTVDLDCAPLVGLFKDYGLSLEVLGIDLLNVFKNPSTGNLYLQSMLVDIDEMFQTSQTELYFEDIMMSLWSIIGEISKHIADIRIRQSRLINIQFQGRNTLILEYTKI